MIMYAHDEPMDRKRVIKIVIDDSDIMKVDSLYMSRINQVLAGNCKLSDKIVAVAALCRVIEDFDAGMYIPADKALEGVVYEKI